MSANAPARTVAIAGISGFVGRALAQRIHQQREVIGVGRGERPKTIPVSEWRTCDLFSLIDAEKTLQGVDVAIYLVHSMLPAATLSQGSFEDFDLIAADNFARAAAKAGVRRIVYLGGLVPPSTDRAPLSKHLRSRLEVERTLGSHGTPVIALRAGMVIGAGGSSFEMMMRLVQRLPWMLTPQWTQTRTQPIDLDDVVALLDYAIDRSELEGQSFDLGGPDILSYREMIARAAAVVGKKPRLVPVPLFSPSLSRLWVSLITGAPKSLVAPLIQSLRHEMVARDRRLQEAAGIPGHSFEESVHRALAKREPKPAEPKAYQSKKDSDSDRYVRSVQRLPLPAHRSAFWAGQEYMRWLPHVLPLFFRVVSDGDSVTFRLFGVPLLVLVFAGDRSADDRSLFYIRGGLLSRKEPQRRGRFEFRAVFEAPFVLAAVHDFEPALPWFLYSYTQALVHLFVMRAFGRHLKRA